MASTRGGARPGAGRPRRNIHLSQETARVLRELVRLWRLEHPSARYSAASVVDDLIYDEAIRRGALDAKSAIWQAIERGDVSEPDTRA